MNGFYPVDDKSGVGGHSIVKCCDLLEITLYKNEIHRHFYTRTSSKIITTDDFMLLFS